MSGPFILFLLAVICVISAVLYAVIKNPHALDAFFPSQAVASTPQTREVGYRVGDSKRFTARMKNLLANTLLTIRDPQNARDVQLQVVTCEVLVGQYQFGSSKEWKPSGDTWLAVLCTNPAWSKMPVLLVQLDTAGYLLRRRVLGPEDAKQFAAGAQEFAHSGQIAGSKMLTYKGTKYAYQDVGVWAVKADVADDAHLPPGVLARWIVAHGSDNTAIFIEDGQGNNDSVWEGWVVDLNMLVKDVLTSDGK